MVVTDALLLDTLPTYVNPLTCQHVNLCDES